ncbi:TonB-dependent receptor [Ideonella sp. DXS29W]|uniref:TonB-dependent receptor n=1 Tax=Ideonella lacteola TaxID=2984193 RepID=A0ABU9BKM5_9BURK
MVRGHSDLWALSGLAAALALAWPAWAGAQSTPVDAGAAAPNTAPAEPAASMPAADADTAQQITVTGTRASLLKARELKRNSAVVQDSIAAEDLGRFPDDNVADSLSHVTGVTISRTHGGEGQFVNVRGLGPAYSIVTLNGRILATDGDGRDFAFDVLPSETIYGADVMKSAEASQIEGSIGGSVNLRSARALANPGRHVSLRLEGQYNDLSEQGGSKVSGVYSDTFAGNRVGVVLGAVVASQRTRSDSVLDFTYNPDSPGEFDANGDHRITPDEQNLLGVCCVAFGAVEQKKQRTALSAAVEWKPTDDLRLTFDALGTRLDAPAIGYHQAYYVEHAEDRWSDVSIRDHLVTGMTIHGLTPEVVTRTENRVVDTSQIGLNGQWKATGDLTLEADGYVSRSVRDSGGKDTWVVAGIPGNHTGYFSANRHALPDIRVTLEDGRDLAAASSTLGNDDYALHWAELGGDDIHDTVKGLSLGGKLAVEWGPVERLHFGVADTRRAKSRRTVDNLENACQYCNYHYTFADLGADVVRPLTLKNFMRHAGGSFPTTFVRFDTAAYFDALKALDGVEILDDNGQPTGTYYDSSLMAARVNPVRSYRVTEDTQSAYFQADLSGDDWSANVGLRLVRTQTTSRTAVNRIIAIDDPTPDDPTSSPDVTYSPAEPVSARGEYTKLLPSVNFAYRFRPDLQLRLAAAKVMSRPSLDQLVPTAEDHTLDRTWRIDVRGDANLKPVDATQADLSLEWYYTRRSMVSGALFWKNIRHFVTYAIDDNVDIGVPGYLFDIQHPINGDRARILGYEFGFQHLFDNGFGVNLKYSGTDTRARVNGREAGDLEGVSRSAVSIALLYEDDRLNAQVALDHSGRYTEALDAVGSYSRYGEPLTWVTASAAYNLTPEITLFIEGKNLTDAYYRANLGRPDALAGFETWGRTYTAGLTIKF